MRWIVVWVCLCVWSSSAYGMEGQLPLKQGQHSLQASSVDLESWGTRALSHTGHRWFAPIDEVKSSTYFSRQTRKIVGVGGLIVFGIGWATGGYYYLANAITQSMRGGSPGAFLVGLVPVLGPALNWLVYPQALSSGFHVLMTSLSFGLQVIGAAGIIAVIVMENMSRRHHRRRISQKGSWYISPVVYHSGAGVGVFGFF